MFLKIEILLKYYVYYLKILLIYIWIYEKRKKEENYVERLMSLKNNIK